MTQTRAYAGLGCNLGDRAENLRNALKAIGRIAGVRVVRASGVIETAPLALMQQPNYLNCVAELDTSLDPRELLWQFMHIEDEMGRARGEKWSPRLIDIDLLLYANKVIHDADLCVPHPQMHLRTFVLAGMAELAPDFAHPVLHQTMSTLAARLGGGDFVHDTSRPQLISVAGVIGVGKTTLAEGLGVELGCRVVREAYDTNPFLARVYAGEKGLALDSQIYFLTSRAEQLGRASLHPGQAVVSDYIFDQEGIYAARWLDVMQLGLYKKVNLCMSEAVCEPVVIVFLHDTPANCLARIRQRGRSYEQKMDVQFLDSLQQDYEAMFGRWTKCPLIRIDAGHIDCRERDEVRRLAAEVKAYIAV